MSTTSRGADHRFTYAEYLAYERDSELKHEFIDGQILAMAGGSRRHNALAPTDPEEPNGPTITNPTLIVEVLSPSTEQEDRGNKWQHYQRIASLQEYVLVSQAEPRVERYRRLASGGWEFHSMTEGKVELLTGATIDLQWLYADLPVA